MKTCFVCCPNQGFISTEGVSKIYKTEIVAMPMFSDFLANGSSDFEDFKSFIIRDRFNRLMIWTSMLLIALQLSVFKYFYPYAAFINADSYGYVQCAFYNVGIDIYPIGYSKFLRLFSVFFAGDTSLVVFQYVFNQFSILALLFSLFYFLSPSKGIQFSVLIFVLINPVYLYMANYVSTDSLFLSLSICWVTTLIWILKRASLGIIIIHALVVVLVFMVRYNALYYPFISLIVFWLKRRELKMTLIGIVLTVGLIGIFVLSTSYRYKRLTGVFQFSPFSGWQLANNGMYAYRFVDSVDRKKLPSKFEGIDREVRLYFDTTKRFLNRFPEEMLIASTVYMWKSTSPLRTYMHKKYKGDTTATEFKQWSNMAPLYSEYGSTLIKTYPWAFVKSYLWPNLIKYYVPPVEFLSTYGFSMDTIPNDVRTWFGYTTYKLNNRLNTNNVKILEPYPTISAVMNAVFVALFIISLMIGLKKLNKDLFIICMLFGLCWTINLVFSVFASPIALRFQMFSLTLSMVCNFILLDFLLRKETEEDAK
ncbi:hypothetical protein [Chitinophaga qingshengii]|uniref:Glycosyltransferase RgtA/B/C/D-like domain-containing protein n=1 Tax=Chitinophaga qingshengii TaxID=1569794 RepID=A0ABR7TMQ9_9BACT|nr:hypothetical protein [Chitinophaga qingshengii]MBC9931762.1 hypothetical protein [Chitinophaga qingshengii]